MRQAYKKATSRGKIYFRTRIRMRNMADATEPARRLLLLSSEKSMIAVSSVGFGASSGRWGGNSRNQKPRLRTLRNALSDLRHELFDSFDILACYRSFRSQSNAHCNPNRRSFPHGHSGLRDRPFLNVRPSVFPVSEPPPTADVCAQIPRDLDLTIINGNMKPYKNHTEEKFPS